MAQLLSHSADRNRFKKAAVGVFLEPDGRLPGFAQRRVDSLISKKKSTGLSDDEERELSEALDYIDTKSAQLLRGGLASGGKLKKGPPTGKK